MKWVADSLNSDRRHFEIRHDPSVGFYLYVFESGKCIKDHLEDTLDLAFEMAHEDYDVRRDAWRVIYE